METIVGGPGGPWGEEPVGQAELMWPEAQRPSLAAHPAVHLHPAIASKPHLAVSCLLHFKPAAVSGYSEERVLLSSMALSLTPPETTQSCPWRAAAASLRQRD